MGPKESTEDSGAQPQKLHLAEPILNRRSFLTKTTTATAGAALAIIGCGGLAAQTEPVIPESTEEPFDHFIDKLTDANFKKEVLNSSQDYPVVVYAYLKWSRDCMDSMPVVAAYNIDSEYPIKIKRIAFETENHKPINQETAKYLKQYGVEIKEAPLFMVFIEGVLVGYINCPFGEPADIARFIKLVLQTELQKRQFKKLPRPKINRGEKIA